MQKPASMWSGECLLRRDRLPDVLIEALIVAAAFSVNHSSFRSSTSLGTFSKKLLELRLTNANSVAFESANIGPKKEPASKHTMDDVSTLLTYMGQTLRELDSLEQTYTQQKGLLTSTLADYLKRLAEISDTQAIRAQTIRTLYWEKICQQEKSARLLG